MLHFFPTPSFSNKSIVLFLWAHFRVLDASLLVKDLLKEKCFDYVWFENISRMKQILVLILRYFCCLSKVYFICCAHLLCISLFFFPPSKNTDLAPSSALHVTGWAVTHQHSQQFLNITKFLSHICIMALNVVSVGSQNLFLFSCQENFMETF